MRTGHSADKSVAVVSKSICLQSKRDCTIISRIREIKEQKEHQRKNYNDHMGKDQTFGIMNSRQKNSASFQRVFERA